VERASITLTKLPELPMLAPRTLTASQMDQFHWILDALQGRPLLAAIEAYRDETRKAANR